VAGLFIVETQFLSWITTPDPSLKRRGKEEGNLKKMELSPLFKDGILSPFFKDGIPSPF
jgi:hypothetical protein